MDYSLGIYEKAFPAELGFPEKIDLAARCGFDRLEISIDESDARLARLDWTGAEQAALGRLAREAGTPIQTMCLSGHRKYPFGSHDPAIRAGSMEIMRKAIRFAVNAGIRVIQLAGYDVYYEKSDNETKHWFLDNLAEAVQYAARRGVILAFETMETPFMDTVEKAMAYVSQINSPWLGVYPDIGNLKNAACLYGSDVVADLKRGAGHTFAMHLKETRPGVYRDMSFGSGHTEYERCIRAALDMGVRLFTGEFWYQKGQDAAKAASEANLFLREKIAASCTELDAKESNGNILRVRDDFSGGTSTC